MLKHKVSNVGQHFTSPSIRNCPNSESTQHAMHEGTTTEKAKIHIQTADSSSNVPDKEIEAKEGLRRITEKYDSVENVMGSSQRSPLGFIGIDDVSFTFTDAMALHKLQEGVTEKDLLQVDTFYRSHKSDVYVCGCLVNLYLCSVKSAFSSEHWVFSCTGIPILLMDSGEHHRERKLFLILAEKGTGFTLWRETIGVHTKYKTPNVNFHTLHISTDSTKLAGLSFDDITAAAEFYRNFQKLTSDENDELLKICKSKKKSVKDRKRSIKLPKKTEISQPCCFVHVTKLDRPPHVETETTNKETTANFNCNNISEPFNFQHLTASSTHGNSQNVISANLTNTTGSKLTPTSTESIDSGLSDDRNSIRGGKG